MKEDVMISFEDANKTDDNMVEFEKAKEKIDEEFNRKIHFPSPVRVH